MYWLKIVGYNLAQHDQRSKGGMGVGIIHYLLPMQKLDSYNASYIDHIQVKRSCICSFHHSIPLIPDTTK